MNLNSGKTDFTNSMAEAMQNAFKEQMDKGQPKSDEQMKIMFIAIAEGVIQHLVQNADAFKVIVDSSHNDITYTTRVEINKR